LHYARLLKHHRDAVGKVICDSPCLPHAANNLRLTRRVRRAIARQHRQNPLMAEVLAPGLERLGVGEAPLAKLIETGNDSWRFKSRAGHDPTTQARWTVRGE
jgi:hypothetical protein